MHCLQSHGTKNKLYLTLRKKVDYLLRIKVIAIKYGSLTPGVPYWNIVLYNIMPTKALLHLINN